MAKQILYIQFYEGELARLEKRCLQRIAGDIASFKFMPAKTVNFVDLDLAHSFDRVILGAGPGDYPKDLPDNIKLLTEKLFELNFPTLGIDFGHLVLAGQKGLEIAITEDTAEINQVVSYQIRDLSSEIMPKPGQELAGEAALAANSFWAYTNHIETVINCPPEMVAARSSKSPAAVISYSRKIFGVEFIPYLDPIMLRWWLNPHPDLWLNILGFWQFKWAQGSPLFERITDWLRYRFLLKPGERVAWDKFMSEFNRMPKQLSESNRILRNFILKIHRQ